METDIRPRFLTSYFDAMKESTRQDGWRAVIPYWVIIGIMIGAGAAIALPDKLWNEQNWQTIVAVYAAILTVNGLLLALSWSAFTRVHELLVSSAEFVVFLRRTKLFNGYLFYIDWVHAAQLIAVIVSAAALFSSLLPELSLLGHRIILAACVASSVYAVRSAVNAVTVMHDLVWQRAVFEEQELQNRGKVVNFSRQQDAHAE
jgi:hypothetical protein